MRVNYSNLGEQSQEPFWRFISCCLSSSPEILSSGPDLSDLSITFQLNGLEVDLLRAWKLFEDYQPPTAVNTSEDPTPTTSSSEVVRSGDSRQELLDLICSLRELRDDAGQRFTDIESSYDHACDYAASAAAEIASDHARERVNEEFHENSPSVSYSRQEFADSFNELISGFEEAINQTDF